MMEKTWTLDEIREELERQRVEPRRTVRLTEDKANRLRSGRWRVLTIAPSGISAAQVWDVDEAELMWLMLRCIEASEFVVSVVALDPAARKEIASLQEGVGHEANLHRL